MKEKLWAFCRKLISLALNLSILYMETIAMPISWDYGHELVFTMYTELSNMFNMVVCALVALCQVLDLFTGRELPRWVKQLKFWSTSCLTMTFLTVVFILAPMYEDGNGWYIMLFTGSMLYHHFLNPVVAMVSFLLFEREPRLPRAASTGPTPLCGYTTRPFRRAWCGSPSFWAPTSCMPLCSGGWAATAKNTAKKVRNWNLWAENYSM